MVHAYRLMLLDPHGGVETIRGEFVSEEDARDFAVREGKTLLSAQRETPAWHQRLAFRRGSRFDTIAFTHDLAVLVDAGVTVKEAISVLGRRERSPANQAVLQQMGRAIESGQPLSEALRASGAVPQLLVATVGASEQTGDVATGLLRYARHQEKLRAVRDRVVGACVYPLLLLVVGMLVIALLLGVVVPRFASLIDVSGRDLPYLSQVLMAWGRWVDAHPAFAAAAAAAVAAALGMAAYRLRRPEVRRRWLQRVPGFSRAAREFQHLQMYRTTAILTARGITVHQAFGYSAELLNPDDQRRLHAAIQLMREGTAISDALTRPGLADVLASSMLAVAERTGSLPEMLDRIADFYEESLRRNIELVSRLIEPLMMILFGIVIGGIVIMMYLPIFDLASSIS